MPLFELPRSRPFALSELQHLYLHNELPYQIGNSWSVEGSVDETVWFDQYFLSGLDGEETYEDLLTSPHLLSPYLQPLHHFIRNKAADDLFDEPQALGQRVLKRNSFNVNSLSVESWEAVLSSNFQAAYPYCRYESISDDRLQSGVARRGVSYSRFPHSLFETYMIGDRPTSIDSIPTVPSEFYRHGARRLTDEQIRGLSEAITSQLRERSRPFHSLSEFISPAKGSEVSILESAIQEVFSVDGKQQWDSSWEAGDNADSAQNQRFCVDPRAPGDLSQADLLTVIGPSLSVRSDTFRLCAVAELIDQTTGRSSRVGIESMAQRLPTPHEKNVDPKGAIHRKLVLLEKQIFR